MLNEPINGISACPSQYFDNKPYVTREANDESIEVFK